MAPADKPRRRVFHKSAPVEEPARTLADYVEDVEEEPSTINHPEDTPSAPRPVTKVEKQKKAKTALKPLVPKKPRLTDTERVQQNVNAMNSLGPTEITQQANQLEMLARSQKAFNDDFSKNMMIDFDLLKKSGMEDYALRNWLIDKINERTKRNNMYDNHVEWIFEEKKEAQKVAKEFCDSVLNDKKSSTNLKMAAVLVQQNSANGVSTNLSSAGNGKNAVVQVQAASEYNYMSNYFVPAQPAAITSDSNVRIEEMSDRSYIDDVLGVNQ